jgi:signal peptidase I
MNWEWIAVFGTVVVSALLFRRYVGFVTRAQAHSMWPTLRPGQLVFTRSVLRGDQIRHGDIAVVRSAELGRRVVKRVMGLPGDRLAFGAGRLVRNDEVLTEPYVIHGGRASGSWLVPEGHCFLLGDNRAASSDSRSWKQPFAPLGAIVGRVCTRRR